jgi:hypothetical protein
MKKYIIISPDGFPIDFEEYKTKKEAIIALKNWCKKYEKQGYYSSNNGQIPLNELQQNCIIKII